MKDHHNVRSRSFFACFLFYNAESIARPGHGGGVLTTFRVDILKINKNSPSVRFEERPRVRGFDCCHERL